MADTQQSKFIPKEHIKNRLSALPSSNKSVKYYAG